MDFKEKYLKYKQKYISLKNLIGGILLDKQSNQNNEFDQNQKQTTNQLVNLDIDCTNYEGINRFKLSRRDSSIFYDYKCKEQYNLGDYRNTIQKNTDLNDYGNGNTIYLDRHEINCNNKGIKDIKFIKENDRIKYDYKCGIYNLNNISNHETNYEDNGQGRNIFLDRHNLNCPNDKILTKIKLKTNHQTNQIKYNYTCGNIPIIHSIIPTREVIGDRFSIIFIPLIYNNLTDIHVLFPDNFIQIFNEVLNGLNIDVKTNLPFKNFIEFNTFIVSRLTKYNIHTYRLLKNAPRDTDFHEDSFAHLTGNGQDRIFMNYLGEDINFDTDFNGNIMYFLQEFVFNVCDRLNGQLIQVYERE